MCLGRFRVVCPDTKVFVYPIFSTVTLSCAQFLVSLALTSENLPYLLPMTWRFPGHHTHLIPCTLLRAELVQSSIKVRKAEFASLEITLIIMCIFNLTCWTFTTFLCQFTFQNHVRIVGWCFRILMSSPPGKFCLSCCLQHLVLEQQDVGTGGGSGLTIQS